MAVRQLLFTFNFSFQRAICSFYQLAGGPFETYGSFETRDQGGDHYPKSFDNHIPLRVSPASLV